MDKASGGRRFLTRNLVYLAGTLTASLLSYVYQFVSGRLLGRAAYGELAALIAAVFLLTLPQNIVSTIATRFTAESGDDDPLIRPLVIRLSRWMVALSVALLGLFLLLHAPISSFLGISGGGAEVPLLAVIAAVLLLLAVNRGALQGVRRFGMLAINFVIDFGARVAAALALIAGGLGVIGALLALALGPTLAYLHALAGLRPYLRPRQAEAGSGANQLSLARIGRFGIWVALGLSGVTYLFNIDVILARHYLAPQDAGIYAAAAILGRVVYITTFAVAQVMFPEVTVLRGRGARHFHVVDLSIGLIVALALPLLFVYYFLPEVVLFFFGAAFEPVAPFLFPFALALTALSLSNLLINYQLSVGDWRFILPLALCCVLEPVLIVAFHGSVAEIVRAVLATNLVLIAVLLAFYLWGRLRPERGGIDAL